MMKGQTAGFREEGYRRFREVVQERGLSLPAHGAWEVAVIFDGDVPEFDLDERFLSLINVTNPRYTGWPLWIDSRGFVNDRGEPDLEAYPYRHGRGYEALIFGQGGGIRNALDFWRAEPAGRFYLYRALQEDLAESPSSPEPLTVLDPVLAVLRTAEAIAVPMAFAKAMGLSPEETTLRFEFRWSGLEGREFDAWVMPERFVSPGYRAQQDTAESRLNVPLEVPTSAIAPFVRVATAPLFAVFGGFAPGPGVIEELTERALSRRM
jgi:hypothetical protein